jgi:hypothetical protein
MFVLGTVAAIRDDSKQFDGAATPDLALVDAEYRDVSWIDATHPSNWTTTLLNQWGETWKASENLTDEQLYPNKNDLDMEQLPKLDAIPVKEMDSTIVKAVEVVSDSLTN